MQVLVKNWLVDDEKTEVAHLWAAVNVWLKYRSCLVVLAMSLVVLVLRITIKFPEHSETAIYYLPTQYI